MHDSQHDRDLAGVFLSLIVFLAFMGALLFAFSPSRDAPTRDFAVPEGKR